MALRKSESVWTGREIHELGGGDTRLAATPASMIAGSISENQRHSWLLISKLRSKVEKLGHNEMKGEPEGTLIRCGAP